MTRIVNALERLHLVLRQPSPTDGRSILLSATMSGKKLLLKGRARRVQALTARITQLTPHQRALLQEAAQVLHQIVPAI